MGIFFSSASTIHMGDKVCCMFSVYMLMLMPYDGCVGVVCIVAQNLFHFLWSFTFAYLHTSNSFCLYIYIRLCSPIKSMGPPLKKFTENYFVCESLFAFHLFPPISSHILFRISDACAHVHDGMPFYRNQMK